MSLPTPPQTDPRQQSRDSGPLDDDAALSALLPPRGVTTPTPAAEKTPRKKRQAPKKDPGKPQTADEVFGFCRKLGRDRLVVELARVAFSDITKTFGPDNLPLPPSEIPHVLGRAIASITVQKTTRRRIGEGGRCGRGDGPDYRRDARPEAGGDRTSRQMARDVRAPCPPRKC